MPPLPNARHERFAQELAKGKSANEAYQLAGFKANEGNCIRLKGNERVIARLEELQLRAANKAECTAADIAKQLDEDRQLARTEKQASAAVSASMGKAKLFGLIRERHEHSGPNGGAIKYDLSGLDDDKLDQLQELISAIAVIGGGKSRDPSSGG
jgi:hypothetical protein